MSRQLYLPLYGPAVAAPERHTLSLLRAALAVSAQTLREQQPDTECPQAIRLHHAPLAAASARLIIDRCAELAALLDLYDDALDDLHRWLHDDDESLPF